MKTPASKKTAAEILALPVCGSCRHWERFPDASQEPGEDIRGDCLLYPPKVIDVDEEGNVLQAAPIVSYRHRCGQHSPQVN